MRFKHICIVARDARKLAAFYVKALGCQVQRPGRLLSGEKVGRGIGLPNARIYSMWLSLPGGAEPLLEIHQFDGQADRPTACTSEPGYRHLAFEVEDLRASCVGILAAGGSQLGDVTTFGTAEAPVLLIYVRDPEGNIIELEQRPARSR